MEKIVIYTDGASRGNPGYSSYGFVIYDLSGKQIYKEGKFVGHATNNIAEYSAVIEALTLVGEKLGCNVEIEVRADSNLVVQQLSGKFKIKSAHIKELVNKIKGLEAQFTKITYTHIPRLENKEADLLANQALDNL